jgi:uncharacterized protein (TIGR03086 family)
MTDHLELLTRAVDQMGRLIAGVRPGQGGDPTPCAAWDVDALVAHVVAQTGQFATTAGAAAGQGDDGYPDAAARLLAAWRRPGALDRTVALRMGEVPATWLATQQMVELATHAWDLAKATGQPADLDPEVGAAALAFARQNIKPEYRGDEGSGAVMGPEVAVPDDAPVYDRLAAFAGRDPGLRPA